MGVSGFIGKEIVNALKHTSSVNPKIIIASKEAATQMKAAKVAASKVYVHTAKSAKAAHLKSSTYAAHKAQFSASKAQAIAVKAKAHAAIVNTPHAYFAAKQAAVHAHFATQAAHHAAAKLAWQQTPALTKVAVVAGKSALVGVKIAVATIIGLFAAGGV